MSCGKEQNLKIQYRKHRISKRTNSLYRIYGRKNRNKIEERNWNRRKSVGERMESKDLKRKIASD